jgi:hypothetical protein
MTISHDLNIWDTDKGQAITDYEFHYRMKLILNSKNCCHAQLHEEDDSTALLGVPRNLTLTSQRLIR